MKNLNLIIALFLITILGCKEEEEKWKCVSGTCFESSQGVYDSKAECNMYCSSGGGGGSANCNSTPFYGSQNCSSAGYVRVGNNTCCPSNSPYYCPNTNKCYQSCTAAESSGCNNIVFGTGQNTGGNTSGYNCVSGNCIYTSSNATYNSESACEYSCGGSSSGYGDVTFWTRSDLGCGTITVIVNGTYKTITSYYYNGSPGCNSSGCANYSLPTGTYSFTASCTDYTWSGSTVTVSNGGCSTMQLN